MNRAAVSIIIPHYNDPNRLERLLKSIPSDERIEVVIVDDQSVNQNFSWLKKYFNRFKLSICGSVVKSNAGEARNLGLAISNSDYVLFADSDDYFTNGSFPILFDYMTSISFDVIIFDSRAINEETNRISQRDGYRKRIYSSTEKQAAIIATAPWAKLIDRKIIQQNDIYFSSTFVANDICFSTKLALSSNNIKVDRHILYNVTERSESLTKIFNIDVAMTRLSEQNKKFTMMKNNDSKLFNYFKYRYHNLTRFNKWERELQSEQFSELLRQYKSLLGWNVLIVHRLFNIAPSIIRIK